jgi:hypothetical protein
MVATIRVEVPFTEAGVLEGITEFQAYLKMLRGGGIDAVASPTPESQALIPANSAVSDEEVDEMYVDALWPNLSLNVQKLIYAAAENFEEGVDFTNKDLARAMNVDDPNDLKPWKRALGKAQKGHADLLTGRWSVSQRCMIYRLTKGTKDAILNRSKPKG